MADHERESDADEDEAVANARATGGVADETKPDQGSSTGTTPTDEYVGRVAGQDVGYEGETGAEARSEQLRRQAEERDGD